MADEAFSLKDAIALYSGKIDLSHKLWTYLQVVALAVMGFAWSTQRSSPVLGLLLLAFGVFAVMNGLLLVGTQREAIEIKKAVKAYSGAHESDLKEFLPVLETLRPWPLWCLCAAHAGIDVIAVAAIAMRLCAHRVP